MWQWYKYMIPCSPLPSLNLPLLPVHALNNQEDVSESQSQADLKQLDPKVSGFLGPH